MNMKRDGEARGLGPRITQSKRKLNTSRGVEKCANGSLAKNLKRDFLANYCISWLKLKHLRGSFPHYWKRTFLWQWKDLFLNLMLRKKEQWRLVYFHTYHFLLSFTLLLSVVSYWTVFEMHPISSISHSTTSPRWKERKTGIYFIGSS